MAADDANTLSLQPLRSGADPEASQQVAQDAAGGQQVVAAYRTRWLYFWLYAWLQCMGRFMSLYYLNEGLTEDKIGVIFAVGSVSSVVVGMLTGFVADRLTTKYGAIARLICFVGCVSVSSTAFMLQVWPWPGVPKFWQLLICRIGVDCRVPANSVLDAITVNSLADRTMYGNERLYGAVSWAVVGVILGYLHDRFGPRIVHLCLPVATLLLVATACIVGRPPDKVLTIESSGGSRSKLQLGPLLRSYGSSATKITFFIFAVCLGVGMTFVENLLFLYFRELNASFFVCGLSIAITVIFEVPLFTKSKQLLEFFGARGLLAIAGLAYSTRAVGYTLVPDGAWVLFFEPLHGVTYAAWQTASVEMMATLTPPELMATGQTFLVCVRGVFGVTMANVGGGFVIAEFGESTLYRSASVLVASGLALYIACSRQRVSSPPVA